MRVALISGGGLLRSVIALDIALIVRGDIAARAQASVAQYRARENVAQTFFDLVRSGSGTDASSSTLGSGVLLPLLAAHGVLRIRGDDVVDATIVTGGRRTSDGSIELRAGGDWIPVERIETFSLEQ